MSVQLSPSEADVLNSLLEVGVNLSLESDRGRLLDVILREARKLARAQGGSLYVLQNGLLEFVAVQNEALSVEKIAAGYLRKRISLAPDSLAGFVALDERIMNIPDAYHLSTGMPFAVNHDFDRMTGYQTVSLLALPLARPGGKCVGVLELVNAVDEQGQVIPFSMEDQNALVSLAAMAAVTIHNAMLKDQLRQAHLDTILRLALVAEMRDDNTAEHLRRISRNASRIAHVMGLADENLQRIQYASLMHDIGKIGIPDMILLKPGPLTPEERKIMERHTLIGADILGEPPNEIIAAAREVALTHHERWDGKGYPHSLAGEAIPLPGRIVAVADVFDALTSVRPYKPAFPVERALAIIREGNGTQFDPRVVEAFFALPNP